MHCYKCGAALPPEAANCPACGEATPYNVIASTPEIAGARTDSATKDNTGEEKAPPVSQVEETPPAERTVLQQPPPETPQLQSVTERTVLQGSPQLETPASQVERTVLQQPSQADEPGQQHESPQPMQGQPTPQPGAAQAQQGQSWPQPFPGQQPSQQGPWPQQRQPPIGPQPYPAWQWPQPFPGQQPPQQGPGQPRPGTPQSVPGPQTPQPGSQQPQQGQPWAQPFPGQQPAWPQSYPARQQPQPGAVQPWPQPWAGQPQMQSSPVWQQPQVGMAQPLPGQQVFQATPAPAAQTLPAQRRGLSLAMILLLIIIALVIVGTSGLIYYTAAVHPANLQAQATSVAQDFLTVQAQSLTPEGIYAQATSGKPVINDPLGNPNNSSWQTSFGCTFTAGIYHVTVHQIARSHICLARGSFSNFAFQAQMNILDGPSGGLIFRSDDTLTRYYTFGVTASGICALTLIEGSTQGRTLNFSSSSAIKTGPNQLNLLTVVARGNNIYLYINKQFVASVHDGTYSSGQIGLTATSSANLFADVAFSNAQVWKL